jgi:hypothetical protein
MTFRSSFRMIPFVSRFSLGERLPLLLTAGTRLDAPRGLGGTSSSWLIAQTPRTLDFATT